MSLRITLSARLGAVLAALFAAASANAEFVRVTAANSVGNSVYDIQSFAAASCNSNCGTTNPLNTDGALHGSFSSVVLVSNAVTGTVDVLVADATKGQIIRYTPAYNSSTNQPVNACETVVWPASGSNGQGPVKPDGLSTDANNNLYIVTNKKPALWVLPATPNYACGTNGGYAANPLLIDNSSFFALGDVTLQDTDVATDTTAAWGPGDVLLLIGSKNKANSAELTVYRQATIQNILNGGSAVTAPDAVLIPPSGFPANEFPTGFDFWPSTSAGGHTTILLDTTSGRVLQYDFTANGVAAGYPVQFAKGLGSGLQKLKVGLYLEVPYAFVTSTTPGTGQILQLGAPNGGQTNIVGVANLGANAPDGLAVARAAAVPATACAYPNVPAGTPPPPQNICDIGGKGVAPHTIYNYNQMVTGQVGEQTCVVFNDPRIKNGVFDGTSLDISTVCKGFGHEVIPGTLRGGAGLSGTGFAIVQTGAPGVDNLGGIIVYTNLNTDAILPAGQGQQNPGCPGQIGAWAPRGEANEGGVLKVVNGSAQQVDEFVDMTGWCDIGGMGGRGASDYLVGTILDPAQFSTPQQYANYANQKFLDLQALVTAANTGSDGATLNTDLANINTYLAQGDFACAADEVINFDTDVAGFEPDAAGVPGWAFPGNPNPWGEMRGRAAQMYYVLNTDLLLNTPNNNWPVAAGPTCQTPTVAVTANKTSIAASTPVNITWTSKHAMSCTAWGGSPNDGWPAGMAVPLSSVAGINVTPAGTTTYGVDCKGLGGDSGMTAGDSVVITVVPPPNITSFMANPPSVTAGAGMYSQLSWVETTGANCVVTGGPVTPINGMSAVNAGPINVATTYTLTCTNSVSAQQVKQLTVTTVAAPAIGSFTASPASVTTGAGTSTLSWTETTGASCAVTGGPVTPINSTSVKAGPINVTTTFTLTCTNSLGYQSFAQVTLIATPQVKITSFTANPNKVDGDGDNDDSSMLSWQSSNATACALSGGNVNAVGLATSGSYGVTKINGTTTYTLNCTNTTGGSAVAKTTVTATGEKGD
jgi:hypothetical protein